MVRPFLTTYRPVLVLTLVAAFAEAAYAAINMLALQVFVDEVLNLTAYLGLILGTFLLVEAFMKSVMGALADRYGRWKFLGAAPIVSGSTAVLIVILGTIVRRALSPGGGAAVEYAGGWQILLVLAPLLLIRAVDGIAAAAFWPTMFASMADTAPEHRRTSSMSFLTVAYMTGVALGPPLAGWANDRSPLADRSRPTVTEIRISTPSEPKPRGVFFLEGKVEQVDLAANSLVVAGQRVEVHRRARILEGDKVRPLSSLAPGQTVRLRSSRNKIAAFGIVSILFFVTAAFALALVPRRAPVRTHSGEHDQPLRLSDLTIALRLAPSLVVTAMVVFVSVGSLAGIAPLYAKEIFSLSDLEYGKLFLVPAIVIGCLTLPVGLLSDWWGRARSVHVGIGMTFVAMAAMAAVAILPALDALRSPGILAALATVLGLGFVMGLPAWLATVADVGGEGRRAQMIGAVATSEGVGAFIGMGIGPVLFDQRHRIPFMIHAPMLVSVVFLGIGLLISLFTIPPRSQRHAPERKEDPGPDEAAEALGGVRLSESHSEPAACPPEEPHTNPSPQTRAAEESAGGEGSRTD